jgi:hypothetical protein
MCKVIDIRSIKKSGIPEEVEEQEYGNPLNMYPIELTAHGITYDVFITSDFTIYIKDLETGKIHTLKTLISLHDAEDTSILKNNVYYINGVNSLRKPEYFDSFSLYNRVVSRYDTMKEIHEDWLDDLIFGTIDDMSKDIVFETIINYQGGKLRCLVSLVLDYNRAENTDAPLGYYFTLSNASYEDPKKVLFGYFYILTDYPFPFVIDKEHQPVHDSNSHLTGIKVPFNISPNDTYNAVVIEE